MENTGDKRDVALRQKPTSFTPAYQYVYHNGIVGNWIGANMYWQLGAYSETYARNLTFNSTILNPQDNRYKGFGFALRCLVR